MSIARTTDLKVLNFKKYFGFVLLSNHPPRPLPHWNTALCQHLFPPLIILTGCAKGEDIFGLHSKNSNDSRWHQTTSNPISTYISNADQQRSGAVTQSCRYLPVGAVVYPRPTLHCLLKSWNSKETFHVATRRKNKELVSNRLFHELGYYINIIIFSPFGTYSSYV